MDPSCLCRTVSAVVGPRQRLSPLIVATTLRVCLTARNSRYQMPCHVPVARRPSDIGMLTDEPIRADLMCACGPSASMLHRDRSEPVVESSGGCRRKWTSVCVMDRACQGHTR